MQPVSRVLVLELSTAVLLNFKSTFIRPEDMSAKTEGLGT